MKEEIRGEEGEEEMSVGGGGDGEMARASEPVKQEMKSYRSRVWGLGSRV